MIGIKDIRARIVYLLKQKFDLDVYGDDVKEGFTRPCFFVRTENHVHSSTNYHVDKTISINIYYYPNDRYNNQIETMDIQRRLESVFDLKLIVNDRHFNIIEIESDVVDGILAFSFDIEFSTPRAAAYENVVIYRNENGEFYKDEKENYTTDILEVIRQVGLEVLPNNQQKNDKTVVTDTIVDTDTTVITPDNNVVTDITTDNGVITDITPPTKPTITPVMVSADRQGNIILSDDGEPFIVEVMGELHFKEGL